MGSTGNTRDEGKVDREALIESVAHAIGPYLGVSDWKLRNAAEAALNVVLSDPVLVLADEYQQVTHPHDMQVGLDYKMVDGLWTFMPGRVFVKVEEKL